MRRNHVLKLLASVLVLSATSVFAQGTWPAKPIRLVVPYPAGGGTDYLARMMGERLSKALGQTIVVDNKSGAAGAIGVAEVAKASPDGHTLLMTINDPLVSANTALGAKSIDDVRKLAQSGQKLSYASWGIGGLGHLGGESLNRELSANMVHVPQRGEGPVVQDLLANTVSIGLSSVGTAKQHVAAGKVVPLAVMNPQRVAAMPQVPTLKELGFNDPIYQSSVWMAVMAPSRTPASIIERLWSEIRTITNTPEVRSLLIDRGFEMYVNGPDQATQNYRAEFDIITKRIRDLGIEPQ
jgi:tripartite-type tricarboxylate transporter receptor subunit TctC